MKRITNSTFNAYKTEINARIETLNDKIKVLAALEKRLALHLCDVLPNRQPDERVPGYDVIMVRGKWIWKHFVRNSRSPGSFATKDQAVAAARRDAMEALAYGNKSRDIADILSTIEREGSIRRGGFQEREGRVSQVSALAGIG